MLENLNQSVLNMMENCNHKFIFEVLFRLLAKYNNNKQSPNMEGLIVNYLFKTSENIWFLIDKIDLKRLMVTMHEYLIGGGNEEINKDGIKICVAIITEIVKIKMDSIWIHYQVIKT